MDLNILYLFNLFLLCISFLVTPLTDLYSFVWVVLFLNILHYICCSNLFSHLLMIIPADVNVDWLLDIRVPKVFLIQNTCIKVTLTADSRMCTFQRIVPLQSGAGLSPPLQQYYRGRVVVPSCLLLCIKDLLKILFCERAYNVCAVTSFGNHKAFRPWKASN